MQHVELANELAEDDHSVAGHRASFAAPATHRRHAIGGDDGPPRRGGRKNAPAG